MSYVLTNDQRTFLNLYARQYNQLQDQITRLQDQINRLIPVSNEIRHNIQTIYSDMSAMNEVRSNDRRRYASQTMSSATSIPISTSSVPQPPTTYEVSFSVEDPLDLLVTETTARTFSDIERPLNTECPIRLEPFEPNSEVVQINRCGHVFYPAELSHWFQTNTRCPTCRTELRPMQQQQQSNENVDHLLTTMLYELIFPANGSTTGVTGGIDLSGNTPSRRNRWQNAYGSHRFSIS